MATESDFLSYFQRTIDSITDSFEGADYDLGELGLSLSGTRC